MADSAIENLRASIAGDAEKMTRAQHIEALVQAVDEHEGDAAFLQAQIAGLGLDAKALRQIRSVRKTYNELMGFDPETARRVAS